MFCTVALSGSHPSSSVGGSLSSTPTPALIVCGFGEDCYQMTAGGRYGLHFSVLGRQRSFQFQILCFFSQV